MKVKAGEIMQKPFVTAVEELKRGNANVIGVVFNGLKSSEGKYFYRSNYPYYRYGSNGIENEDKSLEVKH